jgi:hypothetical protein
MAASPTYFHCAPVPLGNDSIIEPGNWGRIIRLYTPNDAGTYNIAYRESVLETYRQLHCPEKPSRLDCIFTCPTIDGARMYRQKWGKLNFIYEVAPVRKCRTHVGDYELALFQIDVPYFDNFPQRVARYWSDELKEFPEALLAGPVKILRRIAL